MRFPLRWRILLFTVLPIVTVVVATLWMVNHRVSRRVRGSIEDDLRRSSAVFENMLESRARQLVIHGQVIAQDPRFFSVLTLPGGPEDAQARATVSGVARDFNTITDADRLRDELQVTTERGWAQDKAEHESFINCIGAPVADQHGRIVGAVSLSVPDVLLDYGQVLELLPELLATTKAISADYN